jgi:aldehyde:ferredoxin oxidoreductase
MAANGFAGKIGIVDLSTGKTESIDTETYEQWVGGHAMATALFWDYCKDKTVDPFDPGNVTVFAANPFSGVGVPTASSRIEMTGIGSYPLPEWYTRSSLGGRIAGSMKRAGFDAFVIFGKSDTQVWINVVNGEITIENAENLWGLDCWETQEEIWRIVTGGAMDGDWYSIHNTRDGGRTTQKPAVMCIGPTGENLARLGTIMHDAGHAIGQSGFGAVWGSKNLKAVSFNGTGSIEIADPAELLAIREELIEKVSYNVDDPAREYPISVYAMQTHAPGYGLISGDAGSIANRVESCEGCMNACRHMYPDTYGNEAFCAASSYYGNDLDTRRKTSDLLNRLGINCFDSGYLTSTPGGYLQALYEQGIAGIGKEVDTVDLDFSQNTGSFHFIEKYLTAIAYRTNEFAFDLGEGMARAARKWGRWDVDSASGILTHPQWGYIEHYNPRIEVEWSYGSMFGDRDTNEHSFNFYIWLMPLYAMVLGEEPPISAENVVKQLAKVSGLDDPMCWDYSEEGIYADPKIKAVAYHRHYTRFWTQSMGFCDWGWPYGFNFNSPDKVFEFDNTEYECRLFKAVTGKGITHAESIELGHKIFTFDRAIWCLQGRHRDMEVFSEYVYTTPNESFDRYPMYLDGKWEFSFGMGRVLDRQRFEEVKTRFYEIEKWDPKTGWPTPETLESMGLDEVAAAMRALAQTPEQDNVDASRGSQVVSCHTPELAQTPEQDHVDA